MIRTLALVFLLATLPLVTVALTFLASRDYVAGGLSLFGAAAMGHLGLELLALIQPHTPEAAASGDPSVDVAVEDALAASRTEMEEASR